MSRTTRSRRKGRSPFHKASIARSRFGARFRLNRLGFCYNNGTSVLNSRNGRAPIVSTQFERMVAGRTGPARQGARRAILLCVFCDPRIQTQFGHCAARQSATWRHTAPQSRCFDECKTKPRRPPAHSREALLQRRPCSQGRGRAARVKRDDIIAPHGATWRHTAPQFANRRRGTNPIWSSARKAANGL
jgi:hypothetical protein